MYHRYFGLREEPFSIAVNPRYLFMSARHRDALAHLLYGVGAGGGFILLTGEVGTGKTTINRCLLEQLPGNTDIAIILNPALDADELLATACDEFGIDYDRERATLKDLTDRLHTFLLDNHREGRNTVLLIDEAQHLKFETLEQIRLLTNLETNTKKLLQIILVGQPELAAMLAKPELRQLSQRITARYNLEPLNLQETDAYIRHRLQVAGLPANQELFPPRVVKAIFRSTRGIPRLINVLCDRVLLGSYGLNQSRVDMKTLRQAIDEVTGEEPATGRGRRRWPLLAAAVLVLVAAGAWYFAPLVLPVTEPAEQTAAPAPSAAAPGTGTPPVGMPAAAVMSDRQLALGGLASHIGLDLPAGEEVCRALSAQGWRCEALGAGSWQDLLEFDSPVVLTLVTPERFLRYGVLVAVEGDTGILQSANRRHRVPLGTLGPLWRGDFELIWQPPEQYVGPVSLGDRGPMVTWLAETFASLDNQSTPLAGDEFNSALEARVRLFQRRFNLQDDGVVGLKTLLKLNTARGAGTTLQIADAEVAQRGGG